MGIELDRKSFRRIAYLAGGATLMRGLAGLLVFVSIAAAEPANDRQTIPAADTSHRGYQLLTQKPYLPPDFDQQTFDALWTVWPEPLRTQAESADAPQRRQLAFKRYGLTGRPDAAHLPLQYVVDGEGNWMMNCFACHGGQLLGQVVPGLPNSQLDLETLTADVRQVKVRLGKTMSRMDIGSLLIPLGKTRGTTNAVMFGVALMSYRDADLNYDPTRLPPVMQHHDMDAPPWWHFHRKRYLYADGFAAKGHRPLMQFMLVQENGPEKFREWEADFRHIYDYLQSLRPPRYPFGIDSDLARQGRTVFRQHCADCHGQYPNADHTGSDAAPPLAAYPGKTVSLEEVDTDPVRLTALRPEQRQSYHDSWFGEYGQHVTRTSPQGYVAPPLDGIWASAPYLHNGSVPTLWHVLHPADRPTVWRRSQPAAADGDAANVNALGTRDGNNHGYDQQRVGLRVETYDRLPRSLRRADQVRQYFNTQRAGKSAAGHDFVDALDEKEKRAVLEYLKTL